MLGARAPLTVKIYQFSSRSLSRIDLHIVYTCIRRSVKFSIRARLAPLIRRNSIYALQTGKRQRKFSSPLRNSMEFSFSQLEEFNYSYFNFSHASSRSYFSERNVESLGVIDSIEFKKKFGKKKKKKERNIFHFGYMEFRNEKLGWAIYKRKGRTRPINRRVASRRPKATTSMVLHLFLAKVERKLDYSRPKLPSSARRAQVPPPIIPSSCFVTGPRPL